MSGLGLMGTVSPHADLSSHMLWCICMCLYVWAFGSAFIYFNLSDIT